MTLRGYDAWKTRTPEDDAPEVDWPPSDERDDFEKGYDQAIAEVLDFLVKNDHRAAAYDLSKVFRLPAKERGR